jgi:glycosyltransferase involved in cell wall biosynthesis
VLGGAERILLDCAARLERPVLVACPDGPLAASAGDAGLDVAPLRERTLHLRAGVGAAAAHAAGLAGLARDAARIARDAEVLVAWGARAVLSCAALPRPTRPSLLAVHCDLAPAGAPGRVLRAATTRADGVVALSQAIADDVLGRRSPQVAVLHPGVDLAHWAPLPPPPPEPPRALLLGALVRWKRADLALEIAARVPGLELELAGATLPGDDGSFPAELQRRAAQDDLRGRVRFLGPLADPRPALARAHLLLHCADAEPYGLALVEALACGRPVVAPDAAGPREIVTGDAGRRYPPGNADAGAAAIAAVLDGAATGAAARALAERSFGIDASAARLRAAVDNLTSAASGPARSR